MLIKFLFPKFLQILFILIILSLSISGWAQYKDLKVKLGDYTYTTKFDTSNYLTTLKIKKGKNTIYYKNSDFPITGITEYDLDHDGTKEVLLDMYSGGAHCCTYLVAARINDDKFKILDSIYWGNSFYEIKDLNNDGRYEIQGANDMFAYAFTNFAQSRFSVIIYAFQKNRFINVTKNFPKLVQKDIDDLREELKNYTDTGYQCMNVDEDTFNTDPGAVKAILAPLVDDYYTLYQVSKGYDLVDSVYKCPDKDKFIQILKTDYKLK